MSSLRRSPSTLPLTLRSNAPQPLWARAALLHPPPLTYQHKPVPRPTVDLPPTHTLVDGLPFPKKATSKKKFRPVKVVHDEDIIRRSYFRDRPWEGYRLRSLVEGEKVGEMEWTAGTWLEKICGLEEVKLEKLSVKPAPELTIAYALYLYKYAPKPLSLNLAYQKAMEESNVLLVAHALKSTYSQLEAESHGVEFDSPLDRFVKAEDKGLQQWEGRIISASGIVTQKGKKTRGLLDPLPMDDMTVKEYLEKAKIRGYDREKDYALLAKEAKERGEAIQTAEDLQARDAKAATASLVQQPPKAQKTSQSQAINQRKDEEDAVTTPSLSFDSMLAESLPSSSLETTETTTDSQEILAEMGEEEFYLQDLDTSSLKPRSLADEEAQEVILQDAWEQQATGEQLPERKDKTRKHEIIKKARSKKYEE